MFWSKFHIISALLIGLMALCLGSSCEMVPKNVRNGRKTVCASFYLLADFAQKIVGDEMDVVCVMPPGADVHSWEPTPKKVLEMTRADAFLMNGAELEEWTEKIQPLLGYIETHISEDLSADVLAKEAYLSKYYLMRRFKAATGYSLHRYVTMKRLLYARTMLSQPSDMTMMMSSSSRFSSVRYTFLPHTSSSVRSKFWHWPRW